MNLESRLSGVDIFLRPDKPELLSRDEDNDPALNPLDTEGERADPALNPPETVGVRADGEETFETVFLIPLPTLLSNEEEVTLLEEEEEEEVDNAGFKEGLLTFSSLVTSDPVEVLKLRSNGNAVVDFLVSGALTLFEGLVTTEGNELLLSSGRERLAGSVVFFSAMVAALFCLLVADTTDGFSDTPPVLFRLVTGTEFTVRDAPATVDFLTLELESTALLGSTFFLIVPLDADTFDVPAAPGFTIFVNFFPPSNELAEAGLTGCFSTWSSPSCTTGSSILVQQIMHFKNKAPDNQAKN